jgi:hypothetical protein
MATIPTFAVGGKIKAADMNFLLGGAATRKPSLRVQLSVVQSVPNATTTTLLWNTVSEDTDSGYNSGTGLYTVVTPGLWLFSARANWASNATGVRDIQMQLNNGIIAESSGPSNGDPGGQGRNSISWVGRLNANDVLQVTVFQTSGGALNFVSGGSTGFSAAWIAA